MKEKQKFKRTIATDTDESVPEKKAKFINSKTKNKGDVMKKNKPFALKQAIKVKTEKKQPLPKETAKTRKDRKTVRKQQNPTFELSVKAKQIWEKLRIQKNRLTPTEKSVLVKELMELVTEHEQKLVNLAYAHDTSRVLQTCLKQGSKGQREKICSQLNDHVIDMSKNGYAKNIVWKMLKYGSPDERNLVILSFKDKAYKLMKNSKSASVIEYAYNNYATAKQRYLLVKQFYGKVFRMCMKSDDDSLTTVLADEPDKKESVLQSYKDALLPLIEKSVIVHTIVHKAFFDFFEHCNIQTIRIEMIELLRDSLVHMVHTHDGAHVAMNCIWHGTKKDQKVIIKSLKEFVLKLSCEEFGYLPLIAAFDCVDDTVFIKKALISSITKGLDALIHNKYGRKLVLYLMSPRNLSHFLPETIKMLSKGDENSTSKKPMDQRHRELSEAASPAIIDYVTKNVRPLAFDRSLFVFVETAILCCYGDTSSLVEAVLSLVDEPFIPGEKNSNGKLHLIEDPSGHLLVKKIIVSESKSKESDPQSKSSFSAALLNRIPPYKMASWSACNRGSQILLSLVKSKDNIISEKSKTLLVKELPSLRINATTVKSTEILCQKIE